MNTEKWAAILILVKVFAPLLSFLVGYVIDSPRQRKQAKADAGNDS